MSQTNSSLVAAYSSSMLDIIMSIAFLVGGLLRVAHSYNGNLPWSGFEPRLSQLQAQHSTTELSCYILLIDDKITMILYRSLYKQYRRDYKEKLLHPENPPDTLASLELKLNVESIVMGRKEAELLVCMNLIQFNLIVVAGNSNVYRIPG